MHVFFCTIMYTNVAEDVRKTKDPNTISGHKFQASILNGLLENECDVTVVNIPRIRRYPNYPRIFFHREPFLADGKAVGFSVGFVNLLALNLITQSWEVFRYLKSAMKDVGNQPCVLLTFNSHAPQSIAMLAIKRKYPQTVLCDFIGDLHGKYGMANTTGGLRGFAVRRIEDLQDILARQFDCYAFHTADMATALGVNDKPFTVIECMYSEQALRTRTAEDDKPQTKTVFYAGALSRIYGIEHLLRAFLLIDDPDYRLVLAGSGDCEEVVRESARKDDRITFLGFVSPDEVARQQRRATILISPRTSEHEYVKYSFPSKTMECLASGKPYVAHKLPCDPPEYAGHIQYADDESDEALKDKIIQICSMSQEERDCISENARSFILNEKNSKRMCSRIVAMWREKMAR